MTSRRILAAVLALLLVYTVAVTAVNSRRYTHEELMAMPAMELFDLFRSRGLTVPDGLDHLTDERLADVFKTEFELWLRGVTAASYYPWYCMMIDTRMIYPTLVVEPFHDFRPVDPKQP